MDATSSLRPTPTRGTSTTVSLRPTPTRAAPSGASTTTLAGGGVTGPTTAGGPAGPTGLTSTTAAGGGPTGPGGGPTGPGGGPTGPGGGPTGPAGGTTAPGGGPTGSGGGPTGPGGGPTGPAGGTTAPGGGPTGPGGGPTGPGGSPTGPGGGPTGPGGGPATSPGPVGPGGGPTTSGTGGPGGPSSPSGPIGPGGGPSGAPTGPGGPSGSSSPGSAVTTLAASIAAGSTTVTQLIGSTVSQLTNQNGGGTTPANMWGSTTEGEGWKAFSWDNPLILAGVILGIIFFCILFCILFCLCCRYCCGWCRPVGPGGAQWCSCEQLCCPSEPVTIVKRRVIKDCPQPIIYGQRGRVLAAGMVPDPPKSCHYNSGCCSDSSPSFSQPIKLTLSPMLSPPPSMIYRPPSPPVHRHSAFNYDCGGGPSNCCQATVIEINGNQGGGGMYGSRRSMRDHYDQICGGGTILYDDEPTPPTRFSPQRCYSYN